MAPNHKHGKGTVVLFNSVNLSTTLNDSSVDFTADTADVTCYGSNDKKYISGQRDATASFSGFVDGSTSAVDRNLETALGGSTAAVVSWGPLGSDVGNSAVIFKGVATAYSVTAPASDAAAVSAAMQVSGGPSGRQSGYWLSDPLTGSTSTGAKTTVQDRTLHSTSAIAGSTRGGVGHCHVVTATTSTGVVKIQHSSGGGTWADILSFNLSSGRSVQRSTVAGAIKEQLRANVTALSTATVYLGVTFARNR